MTIDDLGLLTRTWNCLDNNNIREVDELAKLDDQYLLNLWNFGRKSLLDVKGALQRAGVRSIRIRSCRNCVFAKERRCTYFEKHPLPIAFSATSGLITEEIEQRNDCTFWKVGVIS